MRRDVERDYAMSYSSYSYNNYGYTSTSSSSSSSSSKRYKKNNQDEYDYLPLLPAPMLFVYHMNELLMEVASRIKQRVLPLFVDDVGKAQQAVIEWVKRCAEKEKEMSELQEREWRKREEEQRLERERNERERQKWKQEEEERRKAWSSRSASHSVNTNSNATIVTHGVNNSDQDNTALMQTERSDSAMNQAKPSGRYNNSTSMTSFNNIATSNKGRMQK